MFLIDKFLLLQLLIKYISTQCFLNPVKTFNNYLSSLTLLVVHYYEFQICISFHGISVVLVSYPGQLFLVESYSSAKNTVSVFLILTKRTD